MSTNYEITAWREAARRLNHLQKGKQFQAIAKQDTEEYRACKELSDKLVAEWKAAGSIPMEFRSQVTAPEFDFEDDIEARKHKRKQARDTRRTNKEERAKLEEMKKEAEEKGEEFVMPKKKHYRKRKAQPAAGTVEEKPVAAAAVQADGAEAPKKKPRAARKPRPKKQKAPDADASAPAAVGGVEEPIPFKPVSPKAKEAFLDASHAGGDKKEKAKKSKKLPHP
jgi:hypothetical protein